ncbi:hypothetical protein KJ780_03865, partial [Candidatus Micrarchaeota archaeon]|nr:hypothetical protein [Candidatus Micrarchaeota archaeon]
MGIKEAWNSTCKILLGEEIGDLEKYEKYLMQYIKPLGKEKSFLSEKHVLISENTFCKNSKFISNDEREKAQKLLKETQLDINQVKDIDSIIQALQEAFFYSGNVILGNSHDV